MRIGIGVLLALALVLFGVNADVDSGRLKIYVGTPVSAETGEQDYTCDGVDDDVELQDALDELDATGGMIFMYGGAYSFSATVTRELDNVSIVGVGGAVTISNDGSTPLFDADGDRWYFSCLTVDAGNITMSGDDWTWHNVGVGSSYYPLLSDTEFAGASMVSHGNEWHSVDFALDSVVDGVVSNVSVLQGLSHTQGTDTTLGTMSADIDLNGYDLLNAGEIAGYMDKTTTGINLYVDTGGDDGNDGSSGSPKATIQGALDALPSTISEGCRIYVRAGIYSESDEVIDFDRFDTLNYIYIQAVDENDDLAYTNGKAESGGSSTLTDDDASWVTNQFDDCYVWIYEGTGVGQIKTIASNTDDDITIDGTWTTNPDSTSYYCVGGAVELDSNAVQVFDVYGNKLVSFYGLQFTECTSWAVKYSGNSVGSVQCSYFNGCYHGFSTNSVSYTSAYYNYFDCTAIGVGINNGYGVPRSNVFNGGSDGVYAYYFALGTMSGTAGSKCYFDGCTIGIRVTYGSGAAGATSQVFNGCGTDTSVDAYSWAS